MTCHFEEELTAYVDGELAPERQAAVAAHLGGCLGCQQIEGSIRRTVSVLGALPEFDLQAPGAFAQRALMARLEEPRSVWGRLLDALRRPLVLAPLAAATCALAFALLSHPTKKGMAPSLAAPLGDAELVAELDMFENYDVIGLDRVEDLEVVDRLHELEAP
jgi:anti-sigma factor RsiW